MIELLYAVLVLLAAVVALVGKAALVDRRPQRMGLAFAALSVPLFLAYYADRLPWHGFRTPLTILDGFSAADPAFRSDPVPAFIVCGLLLVQLAISLWSRTGPPAARDELTSLLTSATLVTVTASVLVSTFHWGWIGAVIAGVVYILVYLGLFTLLAAVVEVSVELVKLLGVVLKRRVFLVATWVTRMMSWLSSIRGRMSTRALADRIRVGINEQENAFLDEQDRQDRQLYQAYIRHLARRVTDSSPVELASPLSYELAAPRTPLEKLGDVGSLNEFVESRTSAHVQYLIDNSASVAIGVSGPRGAGKTSLLRRFSDLEPGSSLNGGRYLGVLVSAPTVYDRREFLVYLFQRLCLKISSKAAVNRWPAPHKSRRHTLAWAGFAVLSAAVLAAGVAWPWPLTVWRAVAGNPRTVAAGLGIAGLVISLAVLLVRWVRAWRRRRRDNDISGLAERYYQELSFQETHTWTVAGGIKAPIGEFGSTDSLQRTQQQLSYPQLIDLFSRFLREAGSGSGGEGTRPAKLIICIDELDRVSPAEAAVKLIQDIKGIFNVDGCAFLVSLSAEALALFEQRVGRMKGTLDSVFDTAVEVGPFSLPQARLFLGLRFGALPEPYVWLCHCLSGGIARELNRTVRRLHTLRNERNLDSVPELALAAIQDELAQASGGPGTEVDYADALTYWTMVVTRLFHDAPDRLIEAMRDDNTGNSPVERIAKARRTLSSWTQADRDELGHLLTALGLDRPLTPTTVN